MKKRREIEKRLNAIKELKNGYDEKLKNKEISFNEFKDYDTMCVIAIVELSWVLEKEEI